MNKININELEKILEEHEIWLNSRPCDEEKGHPADLSNTDLSGADLSNRNLSYATLCDINLSNAILDGANLSGADIRRGNLRGASLINAYMSETNLSGADLSGAILNNADLCSASLKFAKLINSKVILANLALIEMNNANLTDADLSYSDFSNATLHHTNFTNTNLECTCMTGANLDHANMIGAKLDYSALPLCSNNCVPDFDDNHIKHIVHYLITIGFQSENIGDNMKEILLNLDNSVDANIEEKELNLRSKWIPCSERLPSFTPYEKSRKVLITLEDSRGKRFVTTAKFNEQHKEWYEFSSGRYYDASEFKVVAWRLKPEPYML